MGTRMIFQVVEKIEKTSDINLYMPDDIEESVADEICEIIAEELENEVSGIRAGMYDTDDVFDEFKKIAKKVYEEKGIDFVEHLIDFVEGDEEVDDRYIE